MTVRLVDLTHRLYDGQPAFPGDPVLQIARHSTIAESGVNVAALRMGTHQGTHLDAPFHCYEDGATVAQIPLDRFYGPAALIDLAPGGRLSARTRLGIERFAPYEVLFSTGAKILYRTGWHQRFGTPEFFTDCPVLTVEAARWMAERRIGLLGMDTPTPETEGLECHRLLLAPGVEVVIVESLGHLDRLPPRFCFVGMPLNLEGGDGSPIRAAALVEDEGLE